MQPIQTSIDSCRKLIVEHFRFKEMRFSSILFSCFHERSSEGNAQEVAVVRSSIYLTTVLKLASDVMF